MGKILLDKQRNFLSALRASKMSLCLKNTSSGTAFLIPPSLIHTVNFRAFEFLISARM